MLNCFLITIDQVKLLNSIGGSFDEAMQNPQSSAEYLEQFKNILKGVEDSLMRQCVTAERQEQRVEELKATHQNVSYTRINIASVRSSTVSVIDTVYAACG